MRNEFGARTFVFAYSALLFCYLCVKLSVESLCNAGSLCSIGLKSFKNLLKRQCEISLQIVKKIVPRLCGCYGEAIDSLISAFTQLHRSGVIFKFETMYEPVQQVVADLWQRKGQISGCFKNTTFIFSSNVKIK